MKVIDESVSDLHENDRVEVLVDKRKDTWKSGTILRQHKDGSYRLTLDDGRELKHVPAKKLARLDYNGDDGGGFMLYDAIDVYDKKNDVWEGAVIQSFNKKGDLFEVLYDDGGDVAQVSRKNIRLPQSKRKNDGQKLAQGDRVYVKPGDHEEEFAATIERVDKDGSCHVKFDDKALGKESFVPRSHIRLMSAEDIAPSPFSIGSIVEVLMNPGYMPPHFERATVERVREDGRCEVRLTSYFHRERGRTYIAQVQHMRFAEAFQVLRPGKRVEVLVPNQPDSAVLGAGSGSSTGGSGSIVIRGGSSFSPAVVEWVHKDGTYVVRTIATRSTQPVLCESVPISSIRIPGMAAGVPRTPFKALFLFGCNFAVEVVVFGVFWVCAAIETVEGFHVFKHSGPRYTESANYISFQQNATVAALAGDATALDAMHACVHHRATQFATSAGVGTGGGAVSMVGTEHGALPPGTIDADELETSRYWLVFFLACNAAVITALVPALYRFGMVRVAMLTNERLDHHVLRSRRHRRRRSWLAAAMAGSWVLSSCCLVTYSTLLNQLRQHCLWGAHTHGLYDLGEYWDDWSPLQARSPYTSLADSVVGIVGKCTFNLYRTLFLLLVVESSAELHRRAMATVPALIVAVLALVKLTGAMTLLHYVQHYKFNRGDYGMSEVTDVAIGNLAFSYWFIVLLLASAVGAKTWDLLMAESRRGLHPASTGERDGQERLRKAANGEFGPAAQRQAEQAKLEAEVVLSSRQYPATYALVFCNQLSVVHVAAAWFCLAANLRIGAYLRDEAKAQAAEGIVGAASDADWAKWHGVDLGLSAVWVAQATLVPIITVLLKVLGPRVDRPTQALPMRY